MCPTPRSTKRRRRGRCPRIGRVSLAARVRKPLVQKLRVHPGNCFLSAHSPTESSYVLDQSPVLIVDIRPWKLKRAQHAQPRQKRLTQMHSPMTTFFALVDVPQTKRNHPSLTPSCRPRTRTELTAGASDLRRKILVWCGAVPSCPPPTVHTGKLQK